MVTAVVFRLSVSNHNLITHYGTIEEELSKIQSRTIDGVRQIICKIREEKLPDHKVTGNAGSFFKNPIVEKALADEIKKDFPKIPVYPVDEKYVKLSAAWLIDQSGGKGIASGNAATHSKQPLVIVNTGNATGREIVDLAEKVQNLVKNKFNIDLEPEVNIL